MNKNELIASIAEKSQTSLRQSDRVLNTTLHCIEEALSNGDKVRIAGFGTFEVKERQARRARNPRTGEIIEVPSSRVPVFKPGKSVKKVVANIDRRKAGLPRVISVTSGKGGAGKTSFVINLAIALAQQQLNVYVIDADLGTANVDVLLGISSRYTIHNLVDGSKKNVRDIVVEGPGGIKIIPGGSGLQSLTELPDEELNRVIEMFGSLDEDADVILIDTGSGISKNVVNFLLASDEVVVIVTPEPHSVTDAYALVKVLDEKKYPKPVKMVFNMVESVDEGKNVARRILEVIGRFLDIKPQPLWYIEKDDNVSRSIKQFKPLMHFNPNSAASKNIRTIAEKLNPLKKAAIVSLMEAEEPKSFVTKLRSLFSKAS